MIKIVVSPNYIIHLLVGNMYGCTTMWQPSEQQVTDNYKTDKDGFITSIIPDGFRLCKHCFRKVNGKWRSK